MDSWPGCGLLGLMTLPRKGRAPATSCLFLTHSLLSLSKGQGQLNSSPLQSMRAQAPSLPLALGDSCSPILHSNPPSPPASLSLSSCLLPSPSPVILFPSSVQAFPFSDLTTFLIPDIQKCFWKNVLVCVGQEERGQGLRSSSGILPAVWGWTS